MPLLAYGHHGSAALALSELAEMVVVACWPSEIAALRTTSALHRAAAEAAVRHWRSPSARASGLQLVERAVGCASLDTVVAAGLKTPISEQLPWPSWRDAVLFLRWCGCEFRQVEGHALYHALRASDAKAVGWLVELRADPEQPVEADLTPLRWAARSGDWLLTQSLLKHGASTNARGRYGYTALMAAAMHGHAEIVELLLSAGAEVNTNGDGETAVDLAHRFPDIVASLERHVQNYGWTMSRPRSLAGPI
mmetsp:Transcript_52918/g.95147  ORF Transcript_52918/g.95147 Transcript_52918/m.95147 type:complete len:251 (+) Transcript_52918:80-832(+)